MARLYGTAIGEKIVPIDDRDTYPTHEDFYGQGGYVAIAGDFSNAYVDDLMGSNNIITSGRRKQGQIVYLPAPNRHYTFTTTAFLVSSYDIKPALPYEYGGSYLSTSFVAKTSASQDSNTISSNLGYTDGVSAWNTEMFEHCSILGGSYNAFIKQPSQFSLGINYNSTIVGGSANKIEYANYSAILGGDSNSLSGNNSYILGGSKNITSGNYNLIGGGELNKISNSNFSSILGGTKNTILSGLSSIFVMGNSLSGIKSDTTYVNNLFASDHIQAKTKSFSIDHPSKPGKTLTYGSLESPYHGIRLTGFNKVNKGICTVELPEYISKLVQEKDINIQITNYRHGKVLYVDNIDLSKNTFTVKTYSVLSKIFDYEFFWTFTAIRTDVQSLIVES